MKKQIVFLLLLYTPFLCAEQYKLVRGNVFYKSDKNASEIRVLPKQLIPNESVLVRMHTNSKESETFEVEDSRGNRFICRAPKEWTARSPQMKNCIQDATKEQKQFTVATTIPMGKAIENYVPQFHYLYTFVSEFDDKLKWESFPYAESDLKSMQAAINMVSSQQIYRNGKRYMLSNPNTTKRHITDCLDTILEHANGGDFILLYLSSHGEKDANGQFQLIAKDSYVNPNTGLYENALSKDEINYYVNQLTAKQAKVVFFLDACYAGAILDNDIKGEAAYYLSTNGSNPAYYNRLLGSPFAVALMEAMTGSLNGVDDHCFKDSMVQVGSLGNYLSNAVFASGSQRPISDEHAFSPAYVLWRIHGSSKKDMKRESALNQRLERQARNNRISAVERANAMLELGDRYYKGIGTSIDFDSSFVWYSRVDELNASKETRAEALYKMSECLYYGNPIQDSVYSFRYALQAAKLGHKDAATRLGVFYVEGYGTEKNSEEGFSWLKKAIKNGSTDALFYQGICYYKGIGTPVNYNKGLKLLQNSAKQGNLYAQQFLVCVYDLGIGVSKDTVQSLKWAQKAADQGSAWAQNYLGVAYYDGMGVEQNYKKAFELYSKSAEQGNELAQYNLGVCYDYGNYVERDFEKAVEWYTKALDLGVDVSAEFSDKDVYSEIVDKQYKLATNFLYGNGSEEELSKAVKWYTIAAENGHPLAQYELGVCYMNGEGVAKDDAKAIAWFEKSSEQGYSFAQHNLGHYYFEGKAVTQDYAKAREYFFKAAKQRNEKSIYFLGVMYYNGLGVEKDKQNGLLLIEKAAELGNEDAAQFLEEHAK